MSEPGPRWFLTCSCGWSRECISGWAAERVAKLHPRLSVPGTQHTITNEEPLADAPPSTQLPLTFSLAWCWIALELSALSTPHRAKHHPVPFKGDT